MPNLMTSNPFPSTLAGKNTGSSSLVNALRTPAPVPIPVPAPVVQQPLVSAPPQQKVVSQLKTQAGMTAQTPSPTGQGAVTTPTSPTNPAPTVNKPVVGSIQYDLAHGLAIGTSSQAGFKPPVEEAAPVTAVDGVKGLVNPAKPTRPTSADTKAAQDAKQAETEAALMKAYAPQLSAIDSAMGNELATNTEDAKYREQAFLQNLAVRGILNTSSEDPVQRKKYYDGEARVSSAIRDKYTLQKMALLGKIGDDAYKAGVKAADDLIAAHKSEIENYYKELDSNRATYKLLSDEKLSEEQLKLDQEQAAADKAYKEGSLSVDKYNSETNRIKAQSDKLVNEAQIRKLNAETGKIGAETSAANGTDASKKATAQEAYDIIQELKTAKGKGAAVGAGFWKTINAVTPGNIQAGSEAEGYKGKIEQLKNTLALGNLDKLKGPMSDKDIEFVRNIVTSLSPSMKETAFDAELVKLENKFIEKGLATPKTAPAAASSDTVNIQTPDGRTGTIPRANLDAALKAGAKQI